MDIEAAAGALSVTSPSEYRIPDLRDSPSIVGDFLANIQCAATSPAAFSTLSVIATPLT
jgi:hypothetical protein